MQWAVCVWGGGGARGGRLCSRLIVYRLVPNQLGRGLPAGVSADEGRRRYQYEYVPKKSKSS